VGNDRETRRWWPRRLSLTEQRLWWQRNGLEVMVRTGRLTAAAVVAYLVARALFPGTQPLTGPLTALLVVQATLFSTLTMGVQRVVSVVSGVLVAVLLSEIVGLTWWSLGLVIAAALVIGMVLRLEEQLLEVPISAMLILGVPGASSAATERIAETLVGAGVGVLFNVVFPPAVRSRTAGKAVQEVAEQAADLLENAARELREQPSEDQALRWLQGVKQLSHAVDAADRALVDFGHSRRLNPRAIRAADTGPILRSGLDALEHSVVALRGLFRAMAEGLREEQPLGEQNPELTAAIVNLLEDLANTFRAYGALVRADAEGGARSTETALAEALDALNQTRAFLTELLIVDAGRDRDHWMLNGTILTSVHRILSELDLEERARQRERWQRAVAQRASRRPVARLRDASRAVGVQRRSSR
jgi:uncharacterized membrane protein YgaE (UPF0421/DUF939 family)